MRYHTTEIRIGEDIVINSFYSLELEEAFNCCHKFKLVLNYTPAIDGQYNRCLEKYIGKPIFIILNKDKKENKFTGIINEVSLEAADDVGASVILKGGGKPQSINCIRETRAFTDLTVQTLIDRYILPENPGIGNNLLSVNVQLKDKVAYIVQYQETAFELLNRLAVSMGEWFFFNGEKLHFGKPDKLPPALELEYGSDVFALNLRILLQHARKAYKFYEHQSDNIFETTTGDTRSGIGNSEFVKLVAQQTQTLSSRYSAAPWPYQVNSEAALKEIAGKEREKDGAKVITVSGVSHIPTLQLAQVLSITTPDSEGKRGAILGSYLVTSVKHEISSAGYKNTFQAIDALAEIIPVDYIPQSKAESEFARIYSINDPEKKGRVKVEFFWPDKQCFSQWIPVFTVHAGATKDGKKNRGIFFMPEAGDVVLVDYLHGDPARPYVAGAMYNDETVNIDNKDNRIKRIASRSGNSLMFLDAEEEGLQQIELGDNAAQKIIIISSDKHSGVYIQSDGKVNIQSPEVQVVSENIVVKANQRLEFLGDTIFIDAQKELQFKGENITIAANDSLAVTGRNAVVGAVSGLQLNGKNINEETIPASIPAIKGGLSIDKTWPESIMP